MSHSDKQFTTIIGNKDETKRKTNTRCSKRRLIYLLSRNSKQNAHYHHAI